MNLYGAPTTYNRITPDRGCGFILKRIYDLTENPNMPRGTYCKNPTKQDVYVGSPFNYRPGWNSSCWAALVRNGLIESDDGMQEYKYYSFYKNSHVGTRAAGHHEAGNGYTVRYHLTPKGNGILIDMMERRVLQKAEKQAFCERNGIEFGTGKTVAGPRPEEWREDDFLEPGETKEEWAARNGVTLTEVTPGPAKRKNETWQKLDAIINDLKNLRDSLS